MVCVRNARLQTVSRTRFFCDTSQSYTNVRLLDILWLERYMCQFYEKSRYAHKSPEFAHVCADNNNKLHVSRWAYSLLSRIGNFMFLKHVSEACRNFADQMFHCYLLLSLVGMLAKAKPTLVTSRVAETSSESDFYFIMHKSARCTYQAKLARTKTWSLSFVVRDRLSFVGEVAFVERWAHLKVKTRL